MDIKRLCGGNIKIKKKGADVGLADVRAAVAAQSEVCLNFQLLMSADTTV